MIVDFKVKDHAIDIHTDIKKQKTGHQLEPHSPNSILILSPLWVRRMLSAMRVLISKITILDLNTFDGCKWGELGVEFWGEFVVEVDSSPLEKVVCEKASETSDSAPFKLLAKGTSPLSIKSEQNKCGRCGIELVTWTAMCEKGNLEHQWNSTYN